MNQDELKETLAALKQLGVKAEVCDTPVPLMTANVVCGTPKEIGDAGIEDNYLLPRSIAGRNPHIFIYAEGNSMIDAGIAPGDRLDVELCNQNEVHDGDIVVARIDGLATVKELYTDEEGTGWLLPYNEAYTAIEITDESDFYVFGRVIGVTHRPIASSSRERAAKVKKARQELRRKAGSKTNLETVIIEMSTLVEHARQWYAVMRALADADVIDASDFTGFVETVQRIVPDHEHLPIGSELRRMAVQSFAKRVALWDSANAPVRGQRFDDYLRIARATLDAI